MLLSIIVPIYNIAPYLDRCLQSIVHQSYFNLQIILVDDASSDASLAIAKGYAQNDRRIEVIEQPHNAGQGIARNVGLKAARGEYVWFVDADDELSHPHVLQQMVAQLEKQRVDILIFNVLKIEESGHSLLLNAHLHQQAAKLNGQMQALKERYHRFMQQGLAAEASFFGMVWDKVYRRLFLLEQDFSFLPQRLYEDEHALLLIDLASCVHFWPAVGYHYWLRSAGSASKELDESFLEAANSSSLAMLSQAASFDGLESQISAACYGLGVYLQRLDRYQQRTKGLNQQNYFTIYNHLQQLLQLQPSKHLLDSARAYQRLSWAQQQALRRFSLLKDKKQKPSLQIAALKRVLKPLKLARAKRYMLALLPYAVVYWLNKRYKFFKH